MRTVRNAFGFLTTEEEQFLELVEKDLCCFLENESCNVVLIFPPFTARLRFLLHQVVERLSNVESFSVGAEPCRRTVVYFKAILHKHWRENIKSMDSLKQENEQVYHSDSSPSCEIDRKRLIHVGRQQESPGPTRRPAQALYTPGAFRKNRQRPCSSLDISPNDVSMKKVLTAGTEISNTEDRPKIDDKSQTKVLQISGKTERTEENNLNTVKSNSPKYTDDTGIDDSDYIVSTHSLTINDCGGQTFEERLMRETGHEDIISPSKGKMNDDIKNANKDCELRVKTTECTTADNECSVERRIESASDEDEILLDSRQNFSCDERKEDIAILDALLVSNSDKSEVDSRCKIDEETQESSCSSERTKIIDVLGDGNTKITEDISMQNQVDNKEEILYDAVTVTEPACNVKAKTKRKQKKEEREKKKSEKMKKKLTKSKIEKNLNQKTASNKSDLTNAKDEVFDGLRTDKQTKDIVKDEYLGSHNDTVVNNSENEVEQDEEDWDKTWNDDGECLDENLLTELNEQLNTSNVEVIQAKFDYLSFKPKDIILQDGVFDHVLEIYDFSPEFESHHLINALSTFQQQGLEITWVDDTHALAVFSSHISALQALNLCSNPLLKLRPLHDGTEQSKRKAKRNIDFLRPRKERPKTTNLIADRMVAGALGMRTKMSKEERKLEREKIKNEREKKLNKEKQKRDLWDSDNI